MGGHICSAARGATHLPLSTPLRNREEAEAADHTQHSDHSRAPSRPGRGATHDKTYE